MEMMANNDTPTTDDASFSPSSRRRRFSLRRRPSQQPLRAKSFWRREQYQQTLSLSGNNEDDEEWKQALLTHHPKAHQSFSSLPRSVQRRLVAKYKEQQQQQQQPSTTIDTPLSDNHKESPYNKDDTTTTTTTTTIQSLQQHIYELETKCAALESQNILVPVQQLDWLARGLASCLSIMVLYLYYRWVVVLWGVTSTWFSWWVYGWNQLVVVLFGNNNNTMMTMTMMIPEGRWMEWWESSSSIMASSFGDWPRVLIQTSLLLLPILYNHWTYGSTHRRFHVFMVAFIIIARVRLCRWREQTFGQSLPSASSHSTTRFGESCTEQGIWDANYEISARFLYVSILQLRGLWTKTAQYLSSRADFVPIAYIRELSKLQDQAPVTPWKDVQRLLAYLPQDIIASVTQEPLASASIGQVHLAKPTDGKGNGPAVVIKVQHPHAQTLMTDDFWSLRVLCKIIGWLEPEYAFMETLMNEWAVEAKKELDFRYEAEHLLEAQVGLQTMFPTKHSVVYTNKKNGSGDDGISNASSSSSTSCRFQVELPQPLLDLSNRNVLVMTFCEGCRVDDFVQIDEWNLSRDAIMDGIAQTYAHFMYCSTIFNGDPHPGNMLVRPGIIQQHGPQQNNNSNSNNNDGSFTLVLLDWGLAKRLSESKRLAFCQMVYAASTLDYGLLLDSYKTVGLKMKREDAGRSMEDMRFFLRDMAPRDVAKKRIKNKIKADVSKAKETKEKVPMESKAYPGEFFFFIRVNELLHGLGSRFDVNLGYLDALRPYAERGLRLSKHYDLHGDSSISNKKKPIAIQDQSLQTKLYDVLEDLKDTKELVGGQICVLDQKGAAQADMAIGTLGGLRDHIPMSREAVILGYSTTKAVTATLAHIMVQEGYLTYDEPVCERVWPAFCPTDRPPPLLDVALETSPDEVAKQWQWKRQITLRHFLNHTSGLWSAFPADLTIQMMASCEDCFAGYECHPDAPEKCILPSRAPGEESEYHFLSYGWLVAGTLCGAYRLKTGKMNATYASIYQELLEPRLSPETKKLGFRPMGGGGDFVMARTVTSDVSASMMMQRKREAEAMQEEGEEDGSNNPMSDVMKTFRGKEFLLDPRIWNSQDALNANVPAAGGRFSAAALAHFYHDLSHHKFFDKSVLQTVVRQSTKNVTTGALQGVTRIANDSANAHTKLSLGYQLIRTDKDSTTTFSGIGHAGVGGSIGFYHRPTGLCVGLMLNKADGGQEVTQRILRVITDHYKI